MAKAKTAKANPRNKKLYDDGMKVRKAVLGSTYVDNSMASADDFMMSFQDVTTEYCWGYVWTRPGLPKKTRSMLNLAMLAALNRGPELKLHVNGALKRAKRLGVSALVPQQTADEVMTPRQVVPEPGLSRVLNRESFKHAASLLRELKSRRGFALLVAQVAHHVAREYGIDFTQMHGSGFRAVRCRQPDRDRPY